MRLFTPRGRSGFPQAFRREALCGGVGRDSLRVRLRVDSGQGRADPFDLPLELLRVPAEVLEPDPMERAAAVDRVVRRVQDAPRTQPLTVLVGRELVVGRTRDD